MLQKSDVNLIQKDLANLDAARDGVFDISRIAVRFAGRAIVELHRGDLQKANQYLGNAASSLKDLEKMMRKREGLKYLANVTLAYQEYAEAKLLYNMMIDKRVLSLDEVGVEIDAYLLGLLDFVGELRRMCLNYLRAGEVSKAEYSLRVMEEIYEDLYSIDHTAIIPNFRHKMDGARRIIETTRGDVVTEVRRLSLETALENFEEKLLKRANP